MKKIIYIANIRLPTEKAHGLQIMKMCEAFAREGIEVELLVPFKINRIKIDPFQFYKIEKNFNIKVIKTPDLIHFGKIGYLISALFFIFFARKYKKENNPKAIVYSRDALTSVGFKNYVLELHDVPLKISKFNVLLWRRVAKFVVKTNFIKKILTDYYFSNKKIEVVFNGVDIASFYSPETKNTAREKLNLPLDKKIILYSGTFYVHDWKGVSTMLEATKLLPQNILSILVGGTKEDIKKINRDYDNKKVLAFEHVLNQDVPLFLRAADILILPNKKGNITSELYTSPLKLFEYMASKTPIIASDLPSIKEVVTDKEVNYFKANDPHSLAQKIIEVLEEPKTANIKSTQAFEKVQNYSWTNQAIKILDFIEKND